MHSPYLFPIPQLPPNFNQEIYSNIFLERTFFSELFNFIYYFYFLLNSFYFLRETKIIFIFWDVKCRKTKIFNCGFVKWNLSTSSSLSQKKFLLYYVFYCFSIVTSFIFPIQHYLHSFFCQTFLSFKYSLPTYLSLCPYFFLVIFIHQY